MKIQEYLAKRTLSLLSLLLLLAVSASPARTAEAALGGCRTDPVFILSDGTVLDVSVDINTDVSNVTNIRYEVHGPKGISLITFISTPTLGFAGKELVTYYADARPNHYWTDSWVETGPSNVGVTAYTTFAGLSLWQRIALSAQYQTISGFNAQHLIAYLTK